MKILIYFMIACCISSVGAEQNDELDLLTIDKDELLITIKKLPDIKIDANELAMLETNHFLRPFYYPKNGFPRETLISNIKYYHQVFQKLKIESPKIYQAIYQKLLIDKISNAELVLLNRICHLIDIEIEKSKK